MRDNYAENGFLLRIIEGRLAEVFLSGTCSVRHAVEKLPIGGCGTHRVHRWLVPIHAASRWSSRFSAGTGPVRNQKERWGVGTEGITVDFIGVFGEYDYFVFLQKEF